jgi:hypothetical protein
LTRAAHRLLIVAASRSQAVEEKACEGGFVSVF